MRVWACEGVGMCEHVRVCGSLVSKPQPEDIIHIQLYRRDTLEHDNVADVKLYPTNVITIKKHWIRNVATGYLCKCVVHTCMSVCSCVHVQVCVGYLGSHLCQSDDLSQVVSDSNAQSPA